MPPTSQRPHLSAGQRHWRVDLDGSQIPGSSTNHRRQWTLASGARVATAQICNGCGEGPREQAPAAAGAHDHPAALRHGRRRVGRLLQRRSRRVGVRRGQHQHRLPGLSVANTGRGAGRAEGVHAARLRGVPLHAPVRRPHRGRGRRSRSGSQGGRDRGRPRGSAAGTGDYAPRRRRLPAGPLRHHENAGRAAPHRSIQRRGAEEEDGAAYPRLAAVSPALHEESPGSLKEPDSPEQTCSAAVWPVFLGEKKSRAQITLLEPRWILF